MKKALQIFLLVLATMMPWAMNAQSTLTVCDDTVVCEFVPIYGYYADDEQNCQMIYPASMLTAMQGNNIEQMVFYIANDGGSNANLGNWNVSLGITTASTLSGQDLTTPLTEVYSGSLFFDDTSDATMMIVTFSTPFIYNGGNLLVEFDHPVSANWNHYHFYGTTMNGAAYSYDSAFNFLPKTTFSYATCPRPSNLTINNSTTTSALISWTGSASSYEYEVLSANGGPVAMGTTTSTSVNITGLTINTHYIVSVRAFCSANDTSSWAVTDFRTAMCDDACPITVVLLDSYGDGWNGGASLSIIDSLTNETIANLTLSTGDSSTVLVPLCNGRDYIVYWNAGSWDAEISYGIYALDGSVIDTVTNPTEGRRLAFNHVCPAVSSDSAFLYLSVNDSDMGTTNPAPGSYSYAIGDTATILAIPNEGFRFVNWTISAMGQVMNFTENPISQEVVSMLAGMTVSVIANFDEADETSDSITVVLSVNHPEMGTTRPAPGTYTFAVGDSVSFYAVPSDTSYFFVNWTVIFSEFPFPVPIADNPLGYTMDELSAGGTYNIIANFTDDTNAVAEGVIVNLSVNDPAMGHTEPGTGRYEYAVGDNINITAYPNEGYEFVGWYTEIFGEGDTVYMNPLVSEEPVEEYMIGWEINITAIFRSSNAISTTEATKTLVFERNGMIVVRGAERQRISIFDVMGRMYFHTDDASAEQTFNPANTGVYLVKVGDEPARRVVVR